MASVRPLQQLLIEPVATLIEELSRLPGIGPKTASRLTFHLLRSSETQSQALAQAIINVKDQVTWCTRCFNIAMSDLCPICADSTRDQSRIVVVEEPLDVLAVERTEVYRGLYHVLHGHIAPLEGIYREHLRIAELLQRLQTEPVEEVILATNPNTEGEATAYLLLKDLAPWGIRVTRLARGLPTGGDLEWADAETLGSALQGRREIA
ncbi:MAG: recombination protein RecR [Chloroflexaceae bacterium]|nr:recombination protein RecR [Chloroflexaceae bacterium]